MTASTPSETHMRAVLWEKAGDKAGSKISLNIGTTKVPTIGPDDVLIRVDAAALNYSDLLLKHGRYTLGQAIAGVEAAGTIAQIGSAVTERSVGDKVCALTDGGAQAEWLCAPADHLIPWPEHLTAAEAAALPEAMATIWSNLIDLAAMKPGETILIHGASGGMGSFAVEVAKAIGLTVLACASSAKAAFVSTLGADHVLDSRDPTFDEKVLSLTEGHGADVIFDVMGASHLSTNINAAAYDGRIVCIGLMGGAEAKLPLGKMMHKRLTLFTTSLRDRPRSAKARIVAGGTSALLPLVTRGAVRPRLARVFNLEEVAQAHDYMESRNHLGKIVLETHPEQEGPIA